MQEKINKLEKIEREYTKPFLETSYEKEVCLKVLQADYQESELVSTAGRIMTRREHGKSVFFDLIKGCLLQ